MPTAAPTAPPPTAPAQPAQSAPNPATPTKTTVVTPPKTAVAPSALSSRPSRRGITPALKSTEPTEPTDTLDGAFAGIKKLGDPLEDDEGGLVEDKGEKPTPDAKPPEETETKKDEVGDEDEAASKTPETPGKRPSPWKLVESYKAKYQELQHEIAELRNKPSEPPKELSERLSSIQKRNEELEQHIRFVDYSKSQEFVEKYQKPYEEAWTRAISGLKGLKVQFKDPNSEEISSRDLTPQDIAALANMDPASARLEIKNRFPEDIAEVRGYVDKIRDLASAQNAALEEQKTKGGDWQKQQAEKAKAIHEANNKLWLQYDKEDHEKHEFLRPVEGQDERNMKLEKATKFIQEALGANANDPNLTDEQRAKIIRGYIGVRNRAIAYSVLMHELKAVKAQLAEREAALKAFEGSEPTDGNGKGKQAGKQAGSGGDVTIDGIAAMLSKFGR